MLFKVSYGSNFGAMGCVTSSNCPVLNTTYKENGINLYCCNKDFCNDINLLVTTTTQTTLSNYFCSVSENLRALFRLTFI